MEELWNLDANALRSLYEQHEKEFMTELLAGKEWKDVQDKRKFLTELSIILHHRTISTNPAEYDTRRPARGQ